MVALLQSWAGLKMDRDFPPLPLAQSDLAKLTEMFPSVERPVVQMVLEGAEGGFEGAMEVLLGMVGPNLENSGQEMQPAVTESSSFARAASTILDSPHRQLNDAKSSNSCPSYPSAHSLASSSSSTFTSPSSSSKCLSPPETDLIEGYKVLVVLRGLPGSGKSTMARKLIASAGLGEIFSTDDFFFDLAGRYKFQPGLLGEAHSENQRKVGRAVARGVRMIVVDNTNTMAWEMKPYISLAVNNGYKVHIMEPNTSWKFKVRQLAQKNTHGVPLFKIKEMMERYEKNINLESLLLEWNLPELKEHEHDCRPDDVEITEEKSSAFKMNEIAEEVKAIESPLPTTDGSGENSSETNLVANTGVITGNDHLPKFEQELQDPQLQKEEDIKIVDYPESSDEEELFMSDSDSEVREPDTALNPCVPEFVPLASRENSPVTLPCALGEEGVQEDREGMSQDWQGVGGLLGSLREAAGMEGPPPPGFIPPPAPNLASEPDISELLGMFPHYTLPELENMYMEHGGSTTSVVTALLDQAEFEETNVLDLRPKPKPAQNRAPPGDWMGFPHTLSAEVQPLTKPGYDLYSTKVGTPDPESSFDIPEDTLSVSSSDSGSQSISMTLDPMFAVGLQEMFGTPVEEHMLSSLSTEEVLEVQVPQSLAMQIFFCWRNTLRSKLRARKANQPIPHGPVPHPASGLEAPRTVLAPNAVEYYEGKLVSQAVQASLNQEALRKKPKPLIVETAPSPSHSLEGRKGRDDGLELFIQQRDELYRKARASSKVQGVAGYYAAEARAVHAKIKERQREGQMELFQEANLGNPANKLDLHFLQTKEAMRQLNTFVAERVTGLKKGGSEWVEVVTGKGNRSDNGKSRLKPAVINWLDQKNLQYSEVNPGCLKIHLKSN